MRDHVLDWDASRDLDDVTIWIESHVCMCKWLQDEEGGLPTSF